MAAPVESGYIIGCGQGGILPLSEVVDDRGVVMAESVLRLRMPQRLFIDFASQWSKPKSPTEVDAFYKLVGEDQMQDIGRVNSTTGQYERIVIGHEALLRKFFPGLLRRGRSSRVRVDENLQVSAEQVVRFRLPIERFLLETEGTDKAYDIVSDKGVIDEMETTRLDPSERERLIVGPEDVIRGLFPSVTFEIEKAA